MDAVAKILNITMIPRLVRERERRVRMDGREKERKGRGGERDRQREG